MLTDSGTKREAVAIMAGAVVVVECAIGALVLLAMLVLVLWGVTQ